MRAEACFKCLAQEMHISRFCKAKIPACDCSKFHFKIMCPGKNYQKHKINSRQLKNLDAESKKRCCFSEKTLSTFAQEMGFECIGEKDLSHSLFCGLETEYCTSNMLLD